VNFLSFFFTFVKFHSRKMNYRKFIFSVFLITVFCFSFGTRGFTAPPEAKQNMILVADTLGVLDSLALKTQFKNPHLSQFYARKALAIAKGQKSTEQLIHAYIIAGVACIANKNDSSVYYYNKALNLSDSTKNKTHKPSIYYNLAVLYSAADYYKTAIILLDSAIRLAEDQKNFSVKSNAFNALGNIKMQIKDFSDARRLYDSAYRIAERYSLYKQMGASLSNLAKFEKETSSSIKKQLIAISWLKRNSGTEDEIASILINIGNRQKKPDSAIYYYKSALKLVQNGNLPSTEIGAYNNLAYSYLDKGDIITAESCIANYAIPLALRENVKGWIASLYDTYADILIAKSDFKGAVTYQKKAIASRIEADNQRASEQVRLLAALLDLNNKELTIQAKEKELLIQSNHLQRFRLWFLISVLFVIGTIFVALWLQQRSRAKLQREQINSAKRIIEMEESEKGRTARELHDITGQLVMGLTGEIENIETLDPAVKTQIKNKITDLGRSIRLISHRMNKAMLEHFTFEELVTGQCTDMQKLTGIKILLEMPEQSLSLREETIQHTYRIIQELLVNAGKYVKNGTIKIIVTSKNDKFQIHYSDNGPGFDPEKLQKSGMGLMNINERAKLIGGRATVNSTPGSGTTWEIIGPVDGKK